MQKQRHRENHTRVLARTLDMYPLIHFLSLSFSSKPLCQPFTYILQCFVHLVPSSCDVAGPIFSSVPSRWLLLNALMRPLMVAVRPVVSWAPRRQHQGLRVVAHVLRSVRHLLYHPTVRPQSPDITLEWVAQEDKGAGFTYFRFIRRLLELVLGP